MFSTGREHSGWSGRLVDMCQSVWRLDETRGGPAGFQPGPLCALSGGTWALRTSDLLDRPAQQTGNVIALEKEIDDDAGDGASIRSNICEVPIDGLLGNVVIDQRFPPGSQVTSFCVTSVIADGYEYQPSTDCATPFDE